MSLLLHRAGVLGQFVAPGGGGGGGATNAIAIAHGKASTSPGGTVQYTSAGLGGLTPKAAIVIMSKTTADATATADARLSIGFTDGATDLCFGAFKENGAGNEQRRSRFAVAADFRGNSTMAGEAVFSQWVTNGIELEWTSPAEAAYEVMVVLLAGDDLSAKVGSDALSTVSRTQTTGFQPEVVFSAMHGDGLPDYSQLTALTFGACHYDGVSTYTEWMGGTGGDLDGNDGSSRILTSSGSQFDTHSVSYEVNVDNFTASGFDVRADANPSSDEIGWLAISYGGAANYDMGTFVYNNSTGVESVAGMGFSPDAVIGGMGYSSAPGHQSAKCVMGVYALTVDGVSSMSFFAENQADGGAAHSISDRGNLNLVTETGAAHGRASLHSINPGGFSLDWSVAGPYLKRSWYLAVGFS